MKRFFIQKTLFFLLLFYSAMINSLSAQNIEKAVTNNPVLHALHSLSYKSKWQEISSTPLQFQTFHTQGLTKVGDFFFLTGVKVIQWPKPYPTPQNGFDRDGGKGISYLFKFDMKGRLLDSVSLGIDSVYHAGGIDFDGEFLWVPVSEYRRGGNSIIYRIDPNSLGKEIILNFNDHLGAVAFDRQSSKLVGMNYGSRDFYEWEIDDPEKMLKQQDIPLRHIKNQHYYVDYQDCNYIGNSLMLCGGVKKYTIDDNHLFSFGGIEVIGLNDYSSLFDFPVDIWIDPNTNMANNPCFLEIIEGKLRFYFIPEDDISVLYIYQLD